MHQVQRNVISGEEVKLSPMSSVGSNRSFVALKRCQVWLAPQTVFDGIGKSKRYLYRSPPPIPGLRRAVGENRPFAHSGKFCGHKSAKETVKTIAQEMPGDPGATVVTTLVCFLTLCTRGCGCNGRPAFPIFGRKLHAPPGRESAAGMRSYVHCRHRPRRRREVRRVD